MLHLNDRAWKEFAFEQLFIVKRGQSVYKQYMKHGNIPYVSASASNNGITDYVDKPNRAANMISLAYDGSVGSAFYQNTPWFASEKIVSLELKNYTLTRYIAMFLCRVIHNQKDKYNYAYKWSVGIRMMRSKILVPVTDEGKPDYDFMGQYIKEREESLKQNFNNFVDVEFSAPLTPLEKKKWKAFNLISDEMFYIDEVKTFKSTALVEKNGLLDIVGATSKNNGNVGFLPKQYADYLTKGNCICLIKTGQGSVGDAVYKNGSFVPSNNVCVIRSSWLNKYNGMFIVAEINKQADRYSYGYIRNNPRIRKEQLMLPTTDSGQPDYNYMEQYIKAIMFRKYKNYLEYQNCLTP